MHRHGMCEVLMSVGDSAVRRPPADMRTSRIHPPHMTSGRPDRGVLAARCCCRAHSVMKNKTAMKCFQRHFIFHSQRRFLAGAALHHLNGGTAAD